MEEFVSDHVVRERHMNFFEDRKMVWNFLKPKLKDMCQTMSKAYRHINSKCTKKKDGVLHALIEWDRWLSSFQDVETTKFCSVNEYNLLHLGVIVRSMGKYVVAFFKQRRGGMVKGGCGRRDKLCAIS